MRVRRRLSRAEKSSIHSEVWLRKCKRVQCCKGKVQPSRVAVTNTEEHGSVSPRNVKRSNINMLQGMQTHRFQMNTVSSKHQRKRFLEQISMVCGIHLFFHLRHEKPAAGIHGWH